jgi:hypothetical protein
MSKPKHDSEIDLDDIGHNNSNNPEFGDILNARVSRRNVLRGGVVSAASALFGSLGVSACGGSSDVVAATPSATSPTSSTEQLLGFSAVAKSQADSVVVPAGYTATVLYALGDPLTAGTAAYKNDGTDTNFDNRAGDHHDGMEWFGLSATGTPSNTVSDRGLLSMNHEATTDQSGLKASFFLHANGGTSALPRPAAEVDKEVAVHGVSIVEVRKNTTWQYVQSSTFNRRVTPLTPVTISGPAAGNALLATKYSTNGTASRGTLNNCGTGKTPWGTLLTGEENWANYFARGADNGARTAKDNASLTRYGKGINSTSRHGWESATPGGDQYDRWNITVTGATADTDYRNEMNTFGYIVEIDPYDNTKAIKKRTALGRFAHESAAFSIPAAGQPLAVYMGDDSRGEYIYKYVSNTSWSTADATAADRVAIGDKYLDAGKLYVAKFNADGSGQWIELNIANPAISGYVTYAFADQADVLVNARLAADAVGATKMDRPEWCAVNPANGEIYYTLTNNSNRTTAAGANQVDAANPRAYTDIKNSSTTQSGNVNGHLVRIKEGAGASAATSFTWDVYLFGAEAGASPGFVNLSSLTSDNDFSSPDGLVFSKSTGICWIQTDDGAYTDVTNCMMLAALPGQVGDGTSVTLNYGAVSVTTRVGAKPTASNLKRFLVGPKGCEITGLCETPDGKAIFVNIQHPGESTLMADVTDPTKYESKWPSNAGYGAGSRPRSATVIITKNDGGRIGT